MKSVHKEATIKHKKVSCMHQNQVVKSSVYNQ